MIHLQFLFCSFVYFTLSFDRIETILDSDRVIVMDKGRVQEMDNPQALLSDSKSIFYSLLNESFKNT